MIRHILRWPLHVGSATVLLPADHSAPGAQCGLARQGTGRGQGALSHRERGSQVSGHRDSACPLTVQRQNQGVLLRV